MAKLDYERPRFAWERKFRPSEDGKPFIPDKHSIVWKIGDDVKGTRYAEVQKIHPEKANNIVNVYRVNVIVATYDGALQRCSIRLPPVQLTPLEGNKARAMWLTQSFTPRKRFLRQEDTKLTIEVIKRAFDIAKEHGWGYSEIP